MADLAQQAYEAYADSVGWRSYSGEQLLQWADLPDRIKDGWHAAVAAVVRQTI